MEIYQSLQLNAFISAFTQSSRSDSFLFPANNLMHALPEKEYRYGLSLLREAIVEYENKCHIPPEESKKKMPFFRNNSRVFVGPEMGLFTIPLFEKPPLGISTKPSILIRWDYDKLVEHCLFENIFLVRCKYNPDQIISDFVSMLDVEYDKFFFDEEHTGFKKDSRFFSMLCNACMEVKEPSRANEKQWYLLQLKPYEEAEYNVTGDQLIPHVPIHLPKECLLKISLTDYSDHPLLYGTIGGYLKSVGLSPEIYLEGME